MLLINLSIAIEFSSNWKEAYISAGATIRRQLNQAIFKKIYIDDAGHSSSELNEPFGLMFSEELTLTSRLRAHEQVRPTEKGLDDFWTTLIANRVTTTTKYQINLAPVFADYDLAKVCHDLKNDTLVDLVGQLSNPIPG